MTFDELLEQIPEEDREVFERNPQIREQIEALNQSYQEAVEKVRRWEEWIYGKVDPETGKRTGGVWDPEAQTFKPVVELRKKLEQAEQELNRLRSSGGNMNFDQLLGVLKQQGFVTKQDLEQQFASRDLINTVANNFQYVYSKTAHLPVKHLQEFGEPLDMEKFMQYVTETNSWNDPQGAYDRFVEPMRKKRQEEELKRKEQEWQAKLEEERKKAFEEGKKSASALPVDQGGSSPYVSPYVREKLAEVTEEGGRIKLPQGSKVGDGIRAALAAKLYREGKLTSSEGSSPFA